MRRLFEESLIKNLHRIEKQDLAVYLQMFFQEKHLLQSALDAVGFCFIILDPDSRIVSCNQPTQYFFHKKYEALIGKPVKKLSDSNEFKLAIDKLLSDDFSSEYIEVSVFDRVVKDLVIGINLFEDRSSAAESSTVYRVLVIYDITEWKNKSLVENQKMSIDTLQTLTAGIAHEIKNPLTAIDLHLQLIKRFIGTDKFSGETKLSRWVNVVSEEIKRLEAIVNDFLSSFRPQKPIKTPQNLNDIIEEVVEIFEPQCLEKKIEIVTDLDQTMKTFLFDKDQIKQALINLLHNSIAAIQENPQAEEVGLITVVTKDNQQTVEVIITDNGIGISPHKVGDIFKPFYTSKKMGTGLGLSIVSRIVHDHQGEIILNTDFKEGSQFFLEFSRLPNIHKVKQISHLP